jgi:D-3-phosphoglycerate dehydrogenase
MKKKILITDRFSQESYLFLQQNSFFEIQRTTAPQIPLDQLATTNALIIRSKTRIDENTLKNAPKLQLIITATSGFDHIDLKATTQWGVTVMNTPEANRESAAQLTWALVLSCAQRVLPAYKQVKAGEWNREALIGYELSGQIYGVIGLGRIGSRVAQIAKAFNMSVMAFDPYQDDEAFEKVGAERVSYEELLKSAHVISYHVPKTAETDRMLNRANLESIQQKVILVNTSRGSVIDENDLAWGLEKGLFRAVGLDVFEKEPLSRTSKLLHHPEVVLTPHIAANTEEAFHKASQSAAEKLVRFFVDGSTSDTLPPRVPWYGATSFPNES